MYDIDMRPVMRLGQRHRSVERRQCVARHLAREPLEGELEELGSGALVAGQEVGRGVEAGRGRVDVLEGELPH